MPSTPDSCCPICGVRVGSGFNKKPHRCSTTALAKLEKSYKRRSSNEQRPDPEQSESRRMARGFAMLDNDYYR